MKSMLAQLTRIEGIASDVRQSRITVLSSDAPWTNTYECLFRISGKPVDLRVDGPIFIEDGETVTVIGVRNQNGVFEASAYYNRSSGVSGRSGLGWSRWRGMMIAAVGVIYVFFFVVAHLATSSGSSPDVVENLLFLLNVALGGLIIVWGLLMFMQRQIRNRTIERLLNDA